MSCGFGAWRAQIEERHELVLNYRALNLYRTNVLRRALGVMRQRMLTLTGLWKMDVVLYAEQRQAFSLLRNLFDQA